MINPIVASLCMIDCATTG